MKTNHITALEIRNFQGFNQTVELAPITVITGDPFKGKTTIAAALHYLLAGYIPGVSKKANEIFDDCATGAMMHVGGTCSNGDVLERSISQSGGKTSESAMFNKKKHAGPFVPTVSLDAREYLALSGREQVKMLFGFVDLKKAGADDKAINAKLKAIKIENPTPESEAVIASLCGEISTSYEKRGDATIQEWLASLVPLLKTKKQTANAGVQQMKKSIEAESATAEARPISPTVDRELAQARSNHNSIRARIAELEQKIGKARSDTQRKAELQKESGKPVNNAAEIKKLSAEVEKLRAEVTAYKPSSVHAGATLGNLRTQVAGKEAEIRTIERQIEEHKATFKKLVENGKCPTCGDDDCDALKKRSAKLLAAAVKPSEEKIAVIQKELPDLKKAVQLAEKDLERKTREDAENTAKRNKVFDLGNQIEALRHEQTEYDNATKELQTLGPIPDVATIEKELAEERSKLGIALEKVNKLDEDSRAAVAARALAGQRETIKKQLAKNEAELEVYKLAADAIEETLSELIDKTIGPVVRRANSFASGIIPSSLVYEKGEFGRWNGEHFVTHRRFCGTEKAASYVALSMALVPDSPLRVAYIDELAVMPPKYRAKIYRAAQEAIESGRLDQIITIDWDTEAYKKGGELSATPKGIFQLIEL